MRQGWWGWAGRGALLALLLQLALPLLAMQQAAVRPAGDAAFVICTGAGLVWVKPDGTPAEPGEGDADAGFHWSVCLAKQLTATALLPPASAPLPPRKRQTASIAPTLEVIVGAASATPLPARGPPPVG